MTGHEIYNEGYEAGYESAMADIMDALYDEYDEYDAANEDLFNFDDLDEYDDAMEGKNSPYRQYRKNRNISAAEAKAKIDYARDHDTEKFSGRMTKLANRDREYTDGMLDYAMKRPDKFRHRGDKSGYKPKSSAFRAAVDGPNNTTVPYHRQHLGR